MRIPLELSFKGERHYIQGGDLFNAIQTSVRCMKDGKQAYIEKLSFSRFAYHQCELCLNEKEAPDGAIGSGELVFGEGNRQQFWLREGTQKPCGRRPYDEEGLVAPATFSEQIARLNTPIEYTTIEAVIALAKVLNYRLAEPKEGKWVFGQIDLTQALPAIGESLTIKRTKSLPGRFSINEIIIDGVCVGIIQFIVGTP